MAEVEPPPLFDDEELFYEDKNEINADIEKEVITSSSASEIFT